ncbi:zinc finger C2HC domain-containing protein 1A-like [Argiope bruennichi]|uniref:Zinc finger C2HC domain-containing protein 1A n=1 Tax=Argiope bruennichi TaxID=94029 RepID=A0A8T0EAC2_ARGBR|nr:zinc finger C2HC domain-containing protein 1A-like [Argiope bruennichi]KAF8768337.1 Zinc finger C2HC domain-containing protein 1A [Argiope bruennichi]
MSLPMYDCPENLNVEKDETILKSCQTCGRTFNPKSLERHEKICEKSKKSNHRTVFNSFLQRAREIRAIPVVADEKDKEEGRQKGKRKEGHENLKCLTRGGRNSKEILNNGLSAEKKIRPGYEQCPWCERYFNQKAADRHISWCQEQKNRLPKTPPNAEAMERLKARVKYQAPLPRKKNSPDHSNRLVKSAESIRESSHLRIHSSPPVPSRNLPTVKSFAQGTKLSDVKQQKKLKTNQQLTDSHENILITAIAKENDSDNINKKTVKFKEMFPVYNKERNKNLDMLAALRLRLSELSTSDDFLEDMVLSPEECTLSKKSNSKIHSILSSLQQKRDSWTSDGEGQCSSSDPSFPSINRSGSSEHRLPRFCYNCGTKYPIVSAKYCCECGAQRFILGMNDKPLTFS